MSFFALGYHTVAPYVSIDARPAVKIFGMVP